MDTQPVTRVCFVLVFAAVVGLAGCSDEPDERKQAVYRAEPGRAGQPLPGYGQQYQYSSPPRYPAQSPYQAPPVPAQRPPPQFETRDPGNPWAYQPSQPYAPSQAQPWGQSGGDGYRSAEQGGASGYRFGGYRPLDSEKPKREPRGQGGVPQGAPYPYYPAPYPYGGGMPYGFYPPVGVPPVW